jgi:hypothetical protein
MTRWILGLALVWAGVAEANPDPVRMVVADIPYARVWAAALEGLRDYPIERIAEGDILTGWWERPASANEPGYERVAQRVHLQVEPFGDRITRITAVVEVRGWRDGGWVSLDETESLERDVLAGIRAALR